MRTKLHQFGAAVLIFSLLCSFCLPLASCTSKYTSKENTETKEPAEETPMPSHPSFEEPPKEELLETPLKITEIMVQNKNNASNSQGAFLPFIEFYNSGEEPLSLENYKLSFDLKKEIALPKMQVEKHSHALVFFGKEALKDTVPLLLEESGTAYLLFENQLTMRVSYRNTLEGCSFDALSYREAPPTPLEEGKREEGLLVSEIMASNSHFPIDGILDDYIELYNGKKEDVELSSLYLSSDLKNPTLEKLPEGLLKKGEYKVLVTSGAFHFKLPKDGGTLLLTENTGKTLFCYTYGPLLENEVWTVDKGTVSYPTPGFPNEKENGMKAVTSRKGLVISEVLSSNTKYFPYKNEYCDIIELWNNSDKDLNLFEYFISDSQKNLKKYALPNQILKKGGYVLIHCDNEMQGAAPFGISSEGETLYVTKNDGTISDVLKVPSLPTDRSYGRMGEQLGYFKNPTLGEQNGEGETELLDAPTVDVPTGIYNGTVKLHLQGLGTIYYTTDGSLPTEHSKKYEGETIILEKTGAVRAFLSEEGRIPSKQVTFNYLINLPIYDLPIIKVTMKDEDLFGKEGIYENPFKKIEKEANVTFFEKGREEFSINCGIKISGTTSRAFTKKSFQLEFRKEYGKSRLDYPLFPGNPVESFGNIVLRSGSQSLYASDTMLTDEFITSLIRKGGTMPTLQTQDYRMCNLYLNSEYYGIYFIREKVDNDFLSDHLHVNKNSLSIIAWPCFLEKGSSMQGFDKLWKMIYEEKLDFSVKENYELLKSLVNEESAADMLICLLFFGEVDEDNIRMFKSPEYDGGKWNFILYDKDLCLRSEKNLQKTLYTYMNSEKLQRQMAIFRAFMENEEFRIYFLERLSTHLKGVLAEENTTKRFDEMVKEIEKDMPYQVDRWKGDDFYLSSMDAFYNNGKRLKEYLGETRLKWLISDVANALSLDKNQISHYMGEKFASYLE